MYSEIHNNDTLKKALSLCRGSYQRNILYGREALSGATLRGRAISYSGRYKASSSNLIRKCQEAGLDIREEKRSHNKRVLVIR